MANPIGQATGGYYKLFRPMLRQMARDHEGFMVFNHLIAEAAFEDCVFRFKRYKVPAKRGDLVTSANDISAIYGIDVCKVKRALDEFEEQGTIKQVVYGNRYRVITIVNYNYYQTSASNESSKIVYKNGSESLQKPAVTDEIAEKAKQKLSENQTEKQPVYDAPDRFSEFANTVNCSGITADGKTHDRCVSDQRATDERPMIDQRAMAAQPSERSAVSSTGRFGEYKLIQSASVDRSKEKSVSDQRATDERLMSDQRATTYKDSKPGDSGNAVRQSDILAPAVPAGRQAKTLAVDLVWRAYGQAMMLVHGSDPLRTKKLNGQIAHLIDTVGVTAAAELADYYVLNERAERIVQERHPFGVLVQNVQKYVIDQRTGTRVTKIQAKAIERGSHYDDMEQRLVQRIQGEGKSP